MAIELTDDGTMDTVLRCSDCGAEMRYNYSDTENNERAADLTEEIRRTNAHWTARQVENAVNENLYNEFIAWAIEDATAEHECEPADDEPSEPQEDDLTTTDHETFYQNGKPVLRILGRLSGNWEYYQNEPGKFARWHVLGTFSSYESAVRAYMDRVQFWPNCWFISDHGNAHLMDLTEGKK